MGDFATAVGGLTRREQRAAGGTSWRRGCGRRKTHHAPSDS